MALACQAVVISLVSSSRLAVESLAVMPVIFAVLFVGHSFGFSFQDVGIALMGDRKQDLRIIGNFAFILSLVTMAGLVGLVFTPFYFVVFHQLWGLSPALIDFMRLPIQILAPMPGLMMLLAFQRSVLVVKRKTGFISSAALTELGVIAVTLALGIHYFDLVGAISASIALVLGRLASNAFLIHPSFLSGAYRNHRA